MRHVLIVSLISVMFTVNVFGQTEPEPEKNKADQRTGPVDIIELFIKGSATIKLISTSFNKQVPTNTRPLKPFELDSLNTKEKQPPLLLSSRPAPAIMPLKSWYDGIASASIGMFSTPEIHAGYSARLAGYTFHFDGHYGSSNGHVPHADYMKAGFLVDARYHAPPHYALFGGSVTETLFEYRRSDYTFNDQDIPSDSARSRILNSFQAGVDVSGKTSEVPFSAGMHYVNLAITDKVIAARSIFESGINGNLSLQTTLASIVFGGHVAIDIRDFSSRAVSDNFVELFVNTSDSSYAASAALGLRGGEGTSGNFKGTPTGSAQLTLHIGKEWDARVRASFGTHLNFFSDLLRENPYLSNDAGVDFTHSTVATRAGAYYQPATRVYALAEVGYESRSSSPVFRKDSLGSFMVQYPEMTILDVKLGLTWQHAVNAVVTAELNIRSAQLTNSIAVPYTSPLVLTLRYNRSIIDPLFITIETGYFSSRNVSLTEEKTLPSYLMLNVRTDYQFLNELSAFVRVENMLSSSIFVFEGYRERPAFAALGLEWKF